MTRRTIYTLTLALGGLILTLPVFGTSALSIETSPTTAKSPTDTIIVDYVSPFDAYIVPEGIVCDWLGYVTSNTASVELQHADKILEYSSTPPLDFSTIAILDDFVISEFEPGSPNLFSYLHRSPSNGLNYYRLKITDTSGDMWFSNIIAIELQLTAGNMHPTIVDTEASLFIESPVEEPGELNIYDMNGRLIYSENITLNENSTLIGLDFSTWHTGHYIARVSGEQLGMEIIRFMKR